jgi:hypothetical protein
VLWDSAVRVPARIWRRTRLACVVAFAACLAGGVAPSTALSGQRTNPEELWRAYPLEQKPTRAGGGPAQAPAPRRSTGGPAVAAHKPATGPPWMVLGSVAAGGVLMALVVLTLRAGRVSVAHGIPSSADAEPTGPAIDAPSRKRRAARTTTARSGPVCQIRWSAHSSCFYAVPAGADGAEQRVVRSPPLEWGRASPPEESVEARAALGQLAKDLRGRGWKPLRAKGVDFDEWQWYARRFRWPTGPDGLGEGRS